MTINNQRVKRYGVYRNEFKLLEGPIGILCMQASVNNNVWSEN